MIHSWIHNVVQFTVVLLALSALRIRPYDLARHVFTAHAVLHVSLTESSPAIQSSPAIRDDHHGYAQRCLPMYFKACDTLHTSEDTPIC